jgi:hypothetical protein
MINVPAKGILIRHVDLIIEFSHPTVDLCNPKFRWKKKVTDGLRHPRTLSLWSNGVGGRFFYRQLPDAAETASNWTRHPLVMIAGVIGRTSQAVEEARLARSLGYHAVLLGLSAMKGAKTMTVEGTSKRGTTTTDTTFDDSAGTRLRRTVTLNDRRQVSQCGGSAGFGS